MKIEQNAHLLSNGGVKRNFSSMDDESDETMTECCPHGFQERKVITYWLLDIFENLDVLWNN